MGDCWDLVRHLAGLLVQELQPQHAAANIYHVEHISLPPPRAPLYIRNLHMVVDFLSFSRIRCTPRSRVFALLRIRMLAGTCSSSYLPYGGGSASGALLLQDFPVRC